MTDNILRIAFKGKKSIESKPLYQYDYGQKIKFIDLQLPNSYEVHFSNRKKGTSVTQLGDINGVTIPDIYLQTGLPIYAWIFLHSGQDDGETEYMVTIPVIQRAEPTNDKPPAQYESIIGQTIQALNEAVSNIDSNTAIASQAASNAQNYMNITQECTQTIQSLMINVPAAAEIDNNGLLTFKNIDNEIIFFIQIPIYNGGVTNGY